MRFLPVTKAEMQDRGWEQPDFVLVSGDAYIDHPSFGLAIIGRVLEACGYKAAVLAQPDWRSAEDFKRFGQPRLGFLITAGNVDSMVNHYSVFKQRRKNDVYSPGAQAGKRPDRACIVYAMRAREAYRQTPVILGGLEASLRRLGHYDYWDDRVRRSALLDAKADLLIYGMAEKTIMDVAEALDSGINIGDITWLRGTVWRKILREGDPSLICEGDPAIMLPSFAAVSRDKKEYAKSFALQYQNSDPLSGQKLIEPYGGGVYVVQNPPALPLTRDELDHVYEYEYAYAYHPMYEAQGGVPALTEVKFSIAACRGCFGGCAFCALTFHQGRIVQGRSKASIVKEAVRMTRRPDFKGYIHDVGGPTANFQKPACRKQAKAGACKDRDCLYPKACDSLEIGHSEYLDILRELRSLPGVKKVFIRSGIRYDYAVYDQSDMFIKELCEFHVSGILKTAPEHVSEQVLKRMRKPSRDVFERFCRKFKQINEEISRKQYIVAYFISSHPGSTLKDAVELAEYLKREGVAPDQIQDFYPTPGTLSTCMYYTRLDPLTGEEVYVAASLEEKKLQRALLHFHKPQNADWVRKALVISGRKDLIGYAKHCLIKPKG